jgi:protein containing glucan-binding domain
MSIRNNIARIGATALISCGLVATTVPATFADEAAQEISFTYADSARLITPDTWVEGHDLTIVGQGFKTADGASGSVLALKLNKGAVKINGQDYLEIHADEAGNFNVTVPWQSELQGQVSVDLYLLSGSLKDGDVPRGGKAATVTIKAAANESLPTPAPSESTEPTPAPSEASPSASDSEEPSAPAVEDAKETKPAEDQKSEDQKSEDQKSDEQKSEDQAAPEGDHAEGDSAAPKSSKDSDNLVMGSSDNDNMGSGSGDNLGSGSSNASSKSSASLAKTGASGAMTAAGLGLIALGAGGAVVVATRMRKKA